MTFHCYDAPETEVDAESPVVLVYEPQSHATPVREAAAAAAVAARRSRAQRRRMRRQRGDAGDEEGDGVGARVGCLTEILWDDVQRARDLLRLSRRRKQEVQLAAPDSATAAAGGDSLAEPVSATPALRRLRRLNGRSASLDSRAGDATPATPSRSAEADADDVEADGLASQTSTMSSGVAGGRRFGELKRMLRDLVITDRRTDKSLQCNASSIGDESCAELAMPRIRQVTQFPLPLRGPAGDDGDSESAELRKLKDEAAVQVSLVAANQRLLSECPGGRLSSRMKRRRTLDFAKSREKLTSLNTRIAEIRTRDYQPASLPPLDTLPDLVADASCGLSLCSLTSLAAKEPPAAPAKAATATAESPRQLRKFSSLTSSTSAASAENLPPAVGGISHAGSLDSGFLEIPTCPDFRH